MKRYSMIHGLLAAALAVNLALPVTAAGTSSFTDVSDSNTALNADILRLMGVVSGTGGNQFNPNQVLTRAQFCTMAVNFMGLGDQVVLHSTRTIFTDVTSKHWARGYVNLAASTMIGGDAGTSADGETPVAGTPLISGVGDGRFLPDDQISYAQAVTILIRVLAYSSDKVGAVWPDGYLNLAQSIGLTKGLSLQPGSSLTRAQAAQLLVNALKCKTGDGKVYYTTLGETKADTVLLAVNVATDTGDAMGAVRTSNGTYLPHIEDAAPTALQGLRGSLVLNDNQEIITFIPDDSDSVTITLSGDAQPGYVKAGNQQYTISGDTPVYTPNAPEGKSYLECYTSLYSGTQITLFTQRGKVVAIYAGSSSTSASSEAVVVMDRATVATFHQLTGGATNFNIIKNRQKISLSDIKPYDVVTYDSLSNTLVVSDLRMTCYYQDAQPTVATPKTINVLGNEFTVLESAWNTTKDFNLGSTVTLLLTADGKVAGMAKPGAQTRSTAIGMVNDGKAVIFLPNGGTMELEGTVSNASAEGQLVIFSAGKSSFTTSSAAENRAPGPFNVDKMTLGEYTVMAGVRIFEKVSSSGVVPIDLSDLSGSIEAKNIAGYHRNSSGMVDYIILNDVTGNAYEYGMMVGKDISTDPVYDENDELISEGSTRTQWSLVRGLGGTIEFSPVAGYNGRSGDIVGVVTYKNREDKDMIRTIVHLEKFTGVTAKDFFESQGDLYVSVNGQNYRVADNAECYGGMAGNRTDPGSWFRQPKLADRVNAIKAFSSKLTVYIDPTGKQVRVITAG